MRTRVTTVRVLVASPGDTKAERSLVAHIVSDINKLIGQKEHFRLEQLLWEQDSHPDVGADAQDVLNRQLGDYDIFLGIMGSHFGTPTKRADSGTEEEFDRAFHRHLTTPNAVRILFYFRNATVNIFDLDPYQLLQVHNFRNRLQTLGVLYDVYNTPEEFGRKLHSGLAQTTRDLLARQRNRKATISGAAKQRPQTAVALPDWDAQTSANNLSVFPQWARYREVQLARYPCTSFSVKGTFHSQSGHFRFGFKLLPIRERPFGNGSIQSEGNNLVVHIGKNSASTDLFVTSYFNGIRYASDRKIADYADGRPLSLALSVSEDNVASFSVEGQSVFQAHISPEIKSRLLLIAWGDEHEFEVSFHNAVLEYS